MDRLIGFAMVTDAARARAFYVGTLELAFVEENDFAVVLRSGENMVRLPKVPNVQPPPSTVLVWECGNIAERVRELTAAGVAFLRYGWMDQDELGIWSPPNGDKIAWFQDPDGNVLSLSQHVHP